MCSCVVFGTHGVESWWCLSKMCPWREFLSNSVPISQLFLGDRGIDWEEKINIKKMTVDTVMHSKPEVESSAVIGRWDTSEEFPQVRFAFVQGSFPIFVRDAHLSPTSHKVLRKIKHCRQPNFISLSWQCDELHINREAVTPPGGELTSATSSWPQKQA